MNETLINLLQRNRAEKVGVGGGSGEKEERRYHQARLSVIKYLWRSSSQVHRGNATAWPNDESSDEEQDDGNLQNLQDPLDRTDGEMWR